jgi:hypothetical protein
MLDDASDDWFRFSDEELGTAVGITEDQIFFPV